MHRLAVIGGNAAGMSAAAVARRRDPALDVLVFEHGAHTSYSACGIPYLVAGLLSGPDEVAHTGLGGKEAAAVDLPVVTATIEDRTRAGNYPGAGPMGPEGAARRLDVLATAIWSGIEVEELEELELLDLGYAPPFSGVYDPLLIAARQVAEHVPY